MQWLVPLFVEQPTLQKGEWMIGNEDKAINISQVQFAGMAFKAMYTPFPMIFQLTRTNMLWVSKLSEY